MASGSGSIVVSVKYALFEDVGIPEDYLVDYIAAIVRVYDSRVGKVETLDVVCLVWGVR